jgi:methionyl-tRNA formyltransferase
MKTEAEAAGIPVYQPEHFRTIEDHPPLTEGSWDLFVVVAYNHILPAWLLGLPTHGAVNLHPSLLPRWRGASPIRSVILNDERITGVTVMLLDDKMDHGPILAQEVVELPTTNWPIAGQALDTILADAGATLLAETIPQWLSGAIAPQEQPHEAATYCGKITKADGELALDPYHLPNGPEAYRLLCLIRAYDGWPGTYFFHNGTRIKILDAHLSSEGTLTITRIIPEGKGPVDWQQYFPR